MWPGKRTLLPWIGFKGLLEERFLERAIPGFFNVVN
jgi:hypothetical protein